MDITPEKPFSIQEKLLILAMEQIIKKYANLPINKLGTSSFNAFANKLDIETSQLESVQVNVKRSDPFRIANSTLNPYSRDFGYGDFRILNKNDANSIAPKLVLYLFGRSTYYDFIQQWKDKEISIERGLKVLHFFGIDARDKDDALPLWFGAGTINLTQKPEAPILDEAPSSGMADLLSQLSEAQKKNILKYYIIEIGAIAGVLFNLVAFFVACGLFPRLWEQTPITLLTVLLPYIAGNLLLTMPYYLIFYKNFRYDIIRFPYMRFVPLIVLSDSFSALFFYKTERILGQPGLASLTESKIYFDFGLVKGFLEVISTLLIMIVVINRTLVKEKASNKSAS